jgi:hypothetical protein
LDTPSLEGNRAKRTSADDGKFTEGEQKEIVDKPTEVTTEEICQNIPILLKTYTGL